MTDSTLLPSLIPRIRGLVASLQAHYSPINRQATKPHSMLRTVRSIEGDDGGGATVTSIMPARIISAVAAAVEHPATPEGMWQLYHRQYRLTRDHGQSTVSTPPEQTGKQRDEENKHI
jgi:hypothetical protein